MKTPQFCETSSIFEVDNIKNETILRDFLQTWKAECRADGLVPMLLRFFHSTCLKYCACHEKVMPGHTKCCACHANHLSKPEDLMLPNATFLRKSAPGPLTSLMNMSLALRLPHDMHLSRSSSNVPRLPTFLELPQNLHGLLMCGKVQNPLCLPHRTRFNVPKLSHHVVLFLPFDFEMCFAPQRRANFHLSSRQMAPHPPLQ